MTQDAEWKTWEPSLATGIAGLKAVKQLMYTVKLSTNEELFSMLSRRYTVNNQKQTLGLL